MSKYSVDIHGNHILGKDEEGGDCHCWDDNSTLTIYQIKNTSDLNDNGLKCLASNLKPCQFPFKLFGKVTIPL